MITTPLEFNGTCKKPLALKRISSITKRQG
jgi:hypothetical protein